MTIADAAAQAASRPSTTASTALGGQLPFYVRVASRWSGAHRAPLQEGGRCGCSPRSASAPARSRSSAAPSASSPSSPSSPAPRSACRATRRSTSSALGAFTGFVSAYFNTREIAPLVAGLALAATVGCGFTAQLGAMRISEEIDALEVMGVPSLPFLVTTRMIAGFVAVIPLYVIGLLSSYCGDPADRHRLLRAVDGHLRPLLPPVPAAGRRALVVRQGAGLRGRDHPDPLLLRLHAPAAARPASASPSARPCAPRSSRSTSSTSSCQPGHLGRHHDRPDRGVAPCCMTGRRARGVGQQRAAARLRRRVPARARPAGRADRRDLQQGVHRRRARHAEDRPRRQPARAAGRREAARADRRRGALGQLRRRDGAPSTSRCSRRPVGADPGQRHAPGCCPRRCSARSTSTWSLPRAAVAAARLAEGDVITAGPVRARPSSSRGPRQPAAAAAHRAAGQAQRHPQRARHRAGGPRRRSSGENLALVDQLLHRAQPAPARPSSRTSAGWPTSREIYADAAPDLVPMLRNFSVTTEHASRTSRRRTPAFLRRHRRLRRRRPARCSSENERPDHPARPRSAGRRSALLAQVLAGVPLPAAGPGRSRTTHRQGVRQRRAAHHPRGRPGTRAAYQPGEEPRLRRQPRARTAAACRTRARPVGPATTSDDGTERRRQRAQRRAAASCVDPRAAPAGSAEEQRGRRRARRAR